MSNILKKNYVMSYRTFRAATVVSYQLFSITKKEANLDLEIC